MSSEAGERAIAEGLVCVATAISELAYTVSSVGAVIACHAFRQRMAEQMSAAEARGCVDAIEKTFIAESKRKRA